MKTILHLWPALVAAFLGGCCCCPTPAPSPAPVPPPVVIDVHSHLFNAKYVPVKGILVSRGVPEPAAGALAKFLLALCAESPLGPTPAPPEPAKGIEGLKQRSLLTGAALRDAVLREVLGRLPLSQVLTAGEIRDLTALLRGQPGSRVPATSATPLSPAEIADYLESIEALADHDGPVLRSKSVGSYLRFLDTLLASESAIVGTIRTAYPRVDLFVNHLMDLQYSYADQPSFLYPETQIARMLRLQELSGGKILTFGMFDPFRAEAAANLCGPGYAAGLAGFKFYPPTGVRPSLTFIPPRDQPGTVPAQWDSRYAGTTAEKLDALVKGFFEYCTAPGADIPVFIHCTPKGFESVPGYGHDMADPEFWKPVLAEHPGLRLCFGHSGGSAGWFASQHVPESADGVRFRDTIIGLCDDSHPNTYCDSAYWEALLTQGGVEELRAVLIKLYRDHPHMAKKLMYGSDWHMLTQEDQEETYLDRFIAVFSVPELAPYRNDFFAGNAIRYLRLKSLATDPRLPAAQRTYLQGLITKGGF